MYGREKNEKERMRKIRESMSERELEREN